MVWGLGRLYDAEEFLDVKTYKNVCDGQKKLMIGRLSKEGSW